MAVITSFRRVLPSSHLTPLSNVLQRIQRQRAHKIAKILEEAQAAAAAIEGVKLTIPAKTSATGTVFGSVGAAQVADALEKLGHVVDRKFIEVKNPVKEIGVYTATIRFHKEVAQEVEFEVVREEETAE